ncbi:MAG: hypothetical protein IBX39_03445 [Candidatus Methanoperedenaceae archaeon]|nr:hypothetical protein [Candidatus Methanoperedenaceae archaeon]
MPYSAKDRQDFIGRIPPNPESLVFDFGGMLSDELPLAVSGITKLKKKSNAVLLSPYYLPFKKSSFDTVLSYHYFDMLPLNWLLISFKETARILKRDSVFSFMTTLWTPQRESQRSTLVFNEILERKGLLFRHELEDLSRILDVAGFGEITVESVKRDITIPGEFGRSHLKILGNILKKEKGRERMEIKTLAGQYLGSVKMHGEAMLPALHITARKI